MSNDIASVQDLAHYLDIDPAEINLVRAELILDLTVEHCRQYVSPLPAAARGLVLRVAARTFQNPASNSYLTVGPNNAGWNASNVYLDRSEIAELRRIGRNGSVSGKAFQIDPAFDSDYGLPYREIFGGGFTV